MVGIGGVSCWRRVDWARGVRPDERLAPEPCGCAPFDQPGGCATSHRAVLWVRDRVS